MRIYLIAIVAIILLFGCQKEKEIEPREYPYVITKEVADIDPTGATFIAETFNLEMGEVTDYGFIWSDMNQEYKYSLREPGKSIKEFSLRVSSGLIFDHVYACRAYVFTNNFQVYGNKVTFKSSGSNPAIINSFSPGYGRENDTVEIRGENFSVVENGNIVRFGSLVANIDSFSENRLIVTIPRVSKADSVYITVQTGRDTAFSESKFDLWFPWKEKSSTIQANISRTCFSINNQGYIINPQSFILDSYNPYTDEIKTVSNLPESSGNMPLSFVVNEKAYVLLGTGFWQYDPKLDSWNKKANFPGMRNTSRFFIYGWVINDSIYLGNCYRYYDLWRYNPEQDLWLRKKDFPEQYRNDYIYGSFAFVIYNKGYLGISSGSSPDTYKTGEFFEYDPTEDTWITKPKSPHNGLSHFCSFSINDEGYVGLGRTDYYDLYKNVSNKIWKYNAIASSWVEDKSCPSSIFSNSSFSINGKGYVIPSYVGGSTVPYSIWEFDPSKN